MEHVVHSGDRTSRHVEIGEISFDQIEVAQVFEVGSPPSQKAVNDADPLATRQQRIHEM